MSRGLHQRAIVAKQRAVACEPNNAVAINSLARTMLCAGRLEEAFSLSKKAMRLFPYPPPYFLDHAGRVNYLTGRYEEAITEFQKYLERFPGPRACDPWAWLIASYMELGREEEAQAQVRKLLKKWPNFSLEVHTKRTKKAPFKDYAFLDSQIELLRKAGIPEKAFN